MKAFDHYWSMRPGGDRMKEKEAAEYWFHMGKVAGQLHDDAFIFGVRASQAEEMEARLKIMADEIGDYESDTACTLMIAASYAHTEACRLRGQQKRSRSANKGAQESRYENEPQ